MNGLREIWMVHCVEGKKGRICRWKWKNCWDGGEKKERMGKLNDKVS
jgi:hypothetical protein